MVWTSVGKHVCVAFFFCYATMALPPASYWWMMMTEKFFVYAFEWILHWKMKLWYKIERCQKIGYDILDCRHWSCDVTIIDVGHAPTVIPEYHNHTYSTSAEHQTTQGVVITIPSILNKYITESVRRCCKRCEIRFPVDTCSSKIPERAQDTCVLKLTRQCIRLATGLHAITSVAVIMNMYILST